MRPITPGLDRRDDLGMLDGRDIALALDLLLGGVHRARDVDRQDELEIDLASSGREPAVSDLADSHGE